MTDTPVDEAVERVKVVFAEAEQRVERAAKHIALTPEGLALARKDKAEFMTVAVGFNDLRALLSALELGSVANASREGSTEPAAPSLAALLADLRDHYVQSVIDTAEAPGLTCAQCRVPPEIENAALADRERINAALEALSASTTDSGKGRLDAEAGGWRPIDDPSLPKGGTPIHVQRTITYRFLPYRKGAPQLQKGIPGRWQVATEYGFENSEPPPQGSRWRPLPAPPTGEGGDVPDPPACAGKDDWS